MKILFFLLILFSACQTTSDWIETPLYPGSLNAVLTATQGVLKRYSENVQYDKSIQYFETDWYNPDLEEVRGYIRRAKILVKVIGTNSPFTITGRVYYEQAILGSNKETALEFQYAGELTKHSRNILRQIMIQAETIDGKFHTIDRVKVF